MLLYVVLIAGTVFLVGSILIIGELARLAAAVASGGVTYGVTLAIAYAIAACALFGIAGHLWGAL